jgi:transcription elongation factor Elf1
MMGYLDRQEVSILCPGCKRENITTVGWIKANDVVHCAGCGKNITLQRNNFLPKLEKAEKAVDAFLEEVRTLGKRI